MLSPGCIRWTSQTSLIDVRSSLNLQYAFDVSKALVLFSMLPWSLLFLPVSFQKLGVWRQDRLNGQLAEHEDRLEALDALKSENLLSYADKYLDDFQAKSKSLI